MSSGETNFLQSDRLPNVKIPPSAGEGSFERAFEAVVGAMTEAGLDPFPLVPAEGLAQAAPFSRLVYLSLQGRGSLAWVIDLPLTRDRVQAILHDAYSLPPQALFHIYSAHPVPSAVRQVLADNQLGLLSRMAIHFLELNELELDEAPEVAAMAAKEISRIFRRPLSLRAPDEALEAIDEILLACRKAAPKGERQEAPAPALAALGLVASEAVRRALPGARFGRALQSDAGDDSLQANNWTFTVDWGETKLEVAAQAFRRYQQGASFALAPLLRRAVVRGH
jgi:hypothetical protein